MTKKVLPKVHDEAEITIRARVVEVGPEVCMVDLIELFQQYRVEKPILVAIPTDVIMSKLLLKEKLPPEVQV